MSYSIKYSRFSHYKNDIYVTVEDLDNRIEEVAKDIKEITKIELVKENKDKAIFAFWSSILEQY